MTHPNFSKRSATIIGMPAFETGNLKSASIHMAKSPQGYRRMRGRLTDHEMQIAEIALREIDELLVHKQALLAMPEWVPIGDAIQAVTGKIKQHREVAAKMLRCDPIELEENE